MSSFILDAVRTTTALRLSRVLRSRAEDGGCDFLAVSFRPARVLLVRRTEPRADGPTDNETVVVIAIVSSLLPSKNCSFVAVFLLVH